MSTSTCELIIDDAAVLGGLVDGPVSRVAPPSLLFGLHVCACAPTPRCRAVRSQAALAVSRFVLIILYHGIVLLLFLFPALPV